MAELRYIDIKDLDWTETADHGVFSADIGPNLSCWRMDDGAAFAEHGHDQSETFVVLSGALRFNDSRMARAGCVVHTSPPESHAATAREETIFLVVTHPRADDQ